MSFYEPFQRKACLKGMVTRGSGRIINMGSYQGIAPNSDASPYCTSKAALLRLTDCTALEVEPHGIAVFAVSPGFVHTDMTRELEALLRAKDPDFEGWDPAWIFPAQDCADLCVRLAVGEADALTGRMIHVRDDLDQMIADADEIVAADRYAGSWDRAPEARQRTVRTAPCHTPAPRAQHS